MQRQEPYAGSTGNRASRAPRDYPEGVNQAPYPRFRGFSDVGCSETSETQNHIPEKTAKYAKQRNHCRERVCDIMASGARRFKQICGDRCHKLKMRRSLQKCAASCWIETPPLPDLSCTQSCAFQCSPARSK